MASTKTSTIWSCLALVIFTCPRVTLAGSFAGRRIPAFAGPFQTRVEHFEQCSLADIPRGLTVKPYNLSAPRFHVNFSRITRPKLNELQHFSGAFTLIEDLDDSLGGMMTFDSWSNGWKPNAVVVKYPDGVCRHLHRFATEAWGWLNLTEGCPVRKGRYPFEDLAIHFKLNKVPAFPYGRYRCQVTLFDARQAVYGCARSYIAITPNTRS